MASPTISESIALRQLSKTASDEEIEAVTRVMGDAFEGDKITNFLVGGFVGRGGPKDPKDKSLVPALHRAQIKAGLIGGKVYVAELESVGIIGAAVWFGPGEELFQSEDQTEAGFNQFMAELGSRDPDMPEWWSTYFLPKYNSFASESFKDPKYKLNGWHLQLIGVHSKYQKHGVGTALIKEIKHKGSKLEQGQSENLWMTLETQTADARRFYKGIGFVDRGEMSVKSEKKSNETCPFWCLSSDLGSS